MAVLEERARLPALHLAAVRALRYPPMKCVCGHEEHQHTEAAIPPPCEGEVADEPYMGSAGFLGWTKHNLADACQCEGFKADA